MAQTIKPPKGRWTPNNPEKPVENYISYEYDSFVIQIGNQKMLSDRISKRCQNLEEEIGYLKILSENNDESAREIIAERRQNLKNELNRSKNEIEKKDFQKKIEWLKSHSNLKTIIERTKELKEKIYRFRNRFQERSEDKTTQSKESETQIKLEQRIEFRKELKYLEDIEDYTDRKTIETILEELKEDTKEIEKKGIAKKLEYLQNFLSQKENYLRRRKDLPRFSRYRRITVEENYRKLEEELEYLKSIYSREVIERFNELKAKRKECKYEERKGIKKKLEYLSNIRTLELDEIRILPITSYYRINGRAGDLGLVESNLLRPFTEVPRHKGLVKVYSTNEGKYVRELGSEENKIHVKNSHYDDILMTIKRYQYKESLLKGRELRDERRERRKKQIEKPEDFVTRYDNDPLINPNLEREKDRLNQLIVEDKLIDIIEEGKKFQSDKVVWKKERQKKLSELIKQIDECEDGTEKDDLKQELDGLKKRKTLKIIEEYRDDLKKELIDIYRKQELNFLEGRIKDVKKEIDEIKKKKISNLNGENNEELDGTLERLKSRKERYEKDQANLSRKLYTWRVNRVVRETSERVFIDDIEHRVVICTVRYKDENQTVELPGLSMLKLEGQAKYNFGWFIKGNELEIFQEKQEKELNEFGWNKDIVCEVICKSKRYTYPDFQLEELRRDDQDKKKWINLSEKWATYISSESIGESITIPKYKKFLKPHPPRGLFQYPENNRNPIRNYLFYGVKGDGLDINGFALYDHNVSASFPLHEKRGLKSVKEIYFTIIDYYNKIEGERDSRIVESNLCLPFYRQLGHEARCILWSNQEERYVNKKNESFNDVLKGLSQIESTVENNLGELEQTLKHYKVIICTLRYRNQDNELVQLPGVSMIILGDKARDQFNGFVSKNLDIYRTREIIGKFYDPGPSIQDEVVKSIDKVSWTEFKNEIRKIIVSEVNPQKFKLEEGDAYFEFSDENKHYSNNEDKTKWQNYIKGKIGKKVRRKITEMSLRTLRLAFFGIVISVLSSIMGILVDWKGFWNLIVDIFT